MTLNGQNALMWKKSFYRDHQKNLNEYGYQGLLLVAKCRSMILVSRNIRGSKGRGEKGEKGKMNGGRESKGKGECCPPWRYGSPSPTVKPFSNIETHVKRSHVGVHQPLFPTTILKLLKYCPQSLRNRLPPLKKVIHFKFSTPQWT